ncbi:MAG: PEP-CTERM sorting domain-containing protein [Opitutaceae bacterium]|jgi:hypothetical protein|nr:PEP-CTERM sorting domain-containing protein [Opitutaceae bacterium]
MKTSSINYMKAFIGSLLLAWLPGSLAAQTVVFSDDFSRADGDAGNGWTITRSSGNGQSGAGLPTAATSNGQLVLKRNGWGDNAGVTLQQDLASKATDLSVDLLNPGVTGGTAGGSNAVAVEISDSTTGAHLRVSLLNMNSDGTFRVQIETLSTSGWGDWSYYYTYPSSGTAAHPGEVTVKFNLKDGKYQIRILVKDTSALLASHTISHTALGGGFDRIRIHGDWTAWTSPPGGAPLAIDNIVATTPSSIPEPANIALLLAGALAVSALATRRRGIRA